MTVEGQKKKFLKLLDEEHNEQVYQDFLETHTRFIPREFVQNHGIGQHLVLRKLSFAADYKTNPRSIQKNCLGSRSSELISNSTLADASKNT
jgi:hypothetical protein